MKLGSRQDPGRMAWPLAHAEKCCVASSTWGLPRLPEEKPAAHSPSQASLVMSTSSMSWRSGSAVWEGTSGLEKGEPGGRGLRLIPYSPEGGILPLPSFLNIRLQSSVAKTLTHSTFLSHPNPLIPPKMDEVPLLWLAHQVNPPEILALGTHSPLDLQASTSLAAQTALMPAPCWLMPWLILVLPPFHSSLLFALSPAAVPWSHLLSP